MYIHNWPLQPFSQDYGLASHTTYVVCVNLIHEWQDLQFNIDSERQIFFKNFFHGRFIYVNNIKDNSTRYLINLYKILEIHAAMNS